LSLAAIHSPQRALAILRSKFWNDVEVRNHGMTSSWISMIRESVTTWCEAVLSSRRAAGNAGASRQRLNKPPTLSAAPAKRLSALAAGLERRTTEMRARQAFRGFL